MRVALLNPSFWPEVRRGSERFVRELADGLIARGHSPRLITSHPATRTDSVEDGLPITRLRRPPQDWLVRRAYEDYLTHVPLSYLSLERGDDDVAHALYPSDALAAVLWSRHCHRPAVLSYMGIPSREWLEDRHLRLRVMRRAIAGSDAVVALSQTAADAFSDVFGVEARVIYPGVDLHAFRPRPDERAAEPTIFCAAAVDARSKRVPLLVAAFERVRSERPGARLVLSRPRDPRAAERLVADADAGIELRDVDDREALATANAEAWISALPSLGEAFGLVLLEALACGTPVVGTRDASLPELVNSDAIGRLFEGDDPDALGRALLDGLELAQDPATAGACRARAEEFSTDRCAAEYEALYAELIEACGQ
ncbi:MAG: glycosyltransferase family 4 protein [Thermoleophilaceae bacterium]